MTYRYSFKEYSKDHMARAALVSANLSLKHAVEVCNEIRNKKLSKAKTILEEVILKKKPIPFKRFNQEIAHRKKIGPGRYPIKTAKQILKLLEEVEANAQYSGLNTSQLKIIHISAKKASRPPHYGRIRGIFMKRATVEVVVKEVAETKHEKKKTKGKTENKEVKRVKTQKSKNDEK